MALKDDVTQAPGADDVKALSEALRATTGTGAAPAIDRRQAPRQQYEVAATLEPVAFGGRPADVRVLTRDADPRGTGFVADGAMLEGERAVMHLPTPDGQTQRIECRIRRSREIANGLFEGSVEFLGEQPQFSDTRIKFTPFRR